MALEKSRKEEIKDKKKKKKAEKNPEPSDVIVESVWEQYKDLLTKQQVKDTLQNCKNDVDEANKNLRFKYNKLMEKGGVNVIKVKEEERKIK